MSRRSVGLGWVLIAVACAKAPEPPPVAPERKSPVTDDEKTLYALGVFHGRTLKPLGLTPAEIGFIQAGLADEAEGKPSQIDLGVYGPKAQNIVQTRQSVALLAVAAAQKAKDAPFLAQAANEPGAVKLPSGLVMKTLTPGTGESPKIADRVRVRYEGHLTDGTSFDSSEKRGGGTEFALVSVLPCWNEALQRMKVGESAQLVCPPSVAFGDQGREPKVPGGATLVFKVELLAVNPKQVPVLARPRRGAHLGVAK